MDGKGTRSVIIPSRKRGSVSICQEIFLFFCLLSTSYLATAKMVRDSPEHKNDPVHLPTKMFLGTRHLSGVCSHLCRLNGPNPKDPVSESRHSLTIADCRPSAGKFIRRCREVVRLLAG